MEVRGRAVTHYRSAERRRAGRRDGRVGLRRGRRDRDQRFDLNIEVTEDNIDDAKAELDGVISQVDPDAGSGKDISLDGFEAFEYDLKPKAPPGARSRYVVLFKGDTEYVINCQATEERREDIAGACRTALETVSPAKG